MRLSPSITATSRKPPTATSLTYTPSPAHHPPSPHCRSPALLTPLASGSSHMSHHISRAAPGKGQRPCELMRVACGTAAGTRTGKQARARTLHTCTCTHTHSLKGEAQGCGDTELQLSFTCHLLSSSHMSAGQSFLHSRVSALKCAGTLARARALLRLCKSAGDGSFAKEPVPGASTFK